MNLGQLIRHKRKLKGYTQEQLGDIIGVSKMAISKYERNIVDNIERKKIVALSKELDIPIVNFLSEIDNDTKTFEQITPSEFEEEVKLLLSKTTNMNEQMKQLLINTLEFICNEDKDKE